MKKLFAVGIVGLILFELCSVWLIMPLPGSQRMRSIDAAYALYHWRWGARATLGLALLAGTFAMWRAAGWRRWVVPPALLVLVGVVYIVNVQMSADHIFRQPTILAMKPASQSTVAMDRLVVGIERHGEARAYPLQYIGYHHQVRDTVGGEEVLVSYCTVCRTARVFAPLVDGRTELFRLVGMDHFNAMLEDQATGSWWRQANGEAIAGPLKGKTLPEIPSIQVTLAQWLALHPATLIMQGDPAFAETYARDYAFERGTSRTALTGTDTVSWHDKSWVIGVSIGGHSKAFDWNRLRRERVINDEVGGAPVVIVMASDSVSFFAFARPDAATTFTARGDSLVTDGRAYAMSGRGPSGALLPIKASQEFWHSWRTFHPATKTY